MEKRYIKDDAHLALDFAAMIVLGTLCLACEFQFERQRGVAKEFCIRGTHVPFECWATLRFGSTSTTTSTNTRLYSDQTHGSQLWIQGYLGVDPQKRFELPSSTIHSHEPSTGSGKQLYLTWLQLVG